MNARFAAVLSLALALVGSVHAVEREVRRVFPVQSGAVLKIDSYRGGITVMESEAAEIVVEVLLEIGTDDEAEAERMRAALQLEITGENNTVSILARNPDETRWRWVWEEDRQIGLTYRISVPRRCDVDVVLKQGSLTVGRLEGRMSARVGKGKVFFRGVDGSVTASTEQGDVVISRCSGPVTVRVGRGTIQTGTIGGRADLRNRSGDVEVMAARGGVEAFAEAGNLSAGIPRQFAGEAALTTSGGNIWLKIDPAANCRLEASSVWSNVQCKLPVVVEAGGNGTKRLVGRLNAGGTLVTARASGGFVRIEPGDMFIE